MSLRASRDGHPPHTSSTRPSQSQPNAYVSPLNALSHQSANLYAASSSNPVLTNRLIPRDYLPSRVRSTPTTDGSSARISPQAPDIRTTSLPSASQSTSQPSISKTNAPGALARKYSGTGKADRDVYSYRQYPAVDEELGQARTRSPESVGTSASVESTVLDSKLTAGSSSRSIQDMPRTSSLDSAISTVSTTSTHQKGQGDGRDPSPASIRGLIATAGSAENLVVHLLKEKNHAESQNNQLWKLVEKQRALLLGLNKDLERVTKDRDRYKKKLKEVQSNGALPRAATQSPSREHVGDNAVKPPDLPQRDETSQESTLESTPQDASSPVDTPTPSMSAVQTSGAPSKPNSRRPTLQAQTAGLAQPTFTLSEATPSSEKSSKAFPARKAPPKPLNLMQSSIEPLVPSSIDPVDQPKVAGDEEDEPRGRRKTREDDDRDREKSLKEQEARSKSKKQAVTPAEPADAQEQVNERIFTPTAILPSIARPQGLAPSNPASTNQGGSMQEKLIALPLRSPGLPASPRPINSGAPGLPVFGSLPMSPRAAVTPLSPRAPKQPIPPPMMSPSPFADPVAIQRHNAMVRATAAAQAAQVNQPPDRLQVHEPSASNEIPVPYQGLVSTAYPNLLLPPNALPSIQIKVASSRLRPSRHSMLGLRTQEESTVFSLSIYSRASRNELWRIEKIPAALPQLEQLLRSRCNDLPRLPDRKLFNGHSPAVIDARRQALDAYFDDLLDMEIDESSALIICRFLSEDVLDPSKEPHTYPGVNQESLPQTANVNGKVVKTGFLTKRGKNFGGWKSRYFVLDSPELKYYDNPGGPQIGSIKLAYARIGSQKVEEPTHGDQVDQYRHAFLIQEPKKKDSNTFVRHVLCAESDTDRDQWVAALLHYLDDGAHSPKLPANPAPFANRSVVQQVTYAKERTNKTGETQSNTPSPTSPASITDSGPVEAFRKGPISGPVNGKPITDVNEWNHRPTAQQNPKDKNSRVPNIFHFKKGSQEQLYQGGKQQEIPSKPRVLRHNGYVRAVFGLALADAVEYCSPFNVDVGLPAVVYRSIEYLRYRNAANEEGLFRLSGSNIVIKTLKERFNTEGDIDLIDDPEYYDVHAVASLFKQYLRELPSPLLTRDLHIEFLKVLELETQAEKIDAFNVLVHRLPQVNFSLVRAMSEYLLEVTENSGKNKMSVRNMGIVFSPTVNIPTPVFNFFLSEFEAIFDREPQQQVPEQPIHSTELQVPSGLSPDDIRSPRHQMFSDIPTPAYNKTNFPDDQAGSNPMPVHGHQTSGSGEFGFTPLHPSYESGQYVTNPTEVPRTQAFAPPPHVQQGQNQEREYSEEQFSSLNRMIQPNDARDDKRRKRESLMF